MSPRTLVVSVPPDQIESFLAQLRSLGRVANFTRQTQRVAKDGGDTDQPADQTLTDKDKVIVNITIKSDDESRKQVSMTVVTATVDDALDQAKTAALAEFRRNPQLIAQQDAAGAIDRRVQRARSRQELPRAARDLQDAGPHGLVQPAAR